MVKLQRRVLMLVLEDPTTAAESFTRMMRDAKIEKAFDKAWEYQVENDYLLDDDTELSATRGGGGGPPLKKQRVQPTKAERFAKTLRHNCGNVGHMQRDCSDPGNPDKVTAEKKKIQGRRK